MKNKMEKIGKNRLFNWCIFLYIYLAKTSWGKYLLNLSLSFSVSSLSLFSFFLLSFPSWVFTSLLISSSFQLNPDLFLSLWSVQWEWLSPAPSHRHLQWQFCEPSPAVPLYSIAPTVPLGNISLFKFLLAPVLQHSDSLDRGAWSSSVSSRIFGCCVAWLCCWWMGQRFRCPHRSLARSVRYLEGA